ncbi:hypothetical protein D3C81_2140030 [compost metagenome]
MRIKKINIGISTITVSVINSGQSTANSPFALYTCSTSVALSDELRNSIGARKSFQIHIVW